MVQPKIGVLALQGCITPHQSHLEAAGGCYIPVRESSQLFDLQGFILPGGESTTQLKLIETLRLEDPLKRLFERIPVWGICAGAILMANQVDGPSQKSFQQIDLHIQRNAYGRQLQSSSQLLEGYVVYLIRAPKIISVGPRVQIHATSESGDLLWVEEDRKTATTFHPELNPQVPSPWHQRFLNQIRAS